jgi:tetratricopeptide (TPR) repeat protein
MRRLLATLPFLGSLFQPTAVLALKPLPPSVGRYKLGMPANSFTGLTELSSAEYALMAPLVGERIYHAQPAEFLGETWQVMLGVAQGHVSKISPYRTVRDQRTAAKLAAKVSAFFRAQLGPPKEEGGLRMWDASDGNAILQTGQLGTDFFVTVFLTSRSLTAKALRPPSQPRREGESSQRRSAAALIDQLGTPAEIESQIERWKEEVRLDPQNFEGLIAIASAYGKLHRYEDALVYCKKAVQVRPHDADAHLLLGTTYGFLRRDSEKITEYKEAIRLRPNFAQAYARLATAYGVAGQNGEALKAARRAVNLDPRSVEGHFALGLALASTGRFTEAEQERSFLSQLDLRAAANLGELIHQLKQSSGKK